VADVAGPLPLLQSLGATSDEVADSLRASGSKGRRDSFLRCPLAVYLHRHGFADAMVGLDSVALPAAGADWPLPSPCASFVALFDRGYYPDLEG
jgi:hypothetical protein